MTPAPHEIALFFVSFFGCLLLDALITAGIAAAFGVSIEVVSLGCGPRVCGLKICGVDWRLSLFPLGSFVRLKGRKDGEPESLDSFSAKGLGPRLLMVLGSSFVLFACCVVAIGLATSIHGLVFSFKNIFQAGIDPSTRGVATLYGTFELLRSGGFPQMASAITLGLIAANLLPLPMTKTGAAACQLFPNAMRHLGRALSAFEMVGVILVIVVWGGWIVAFGLFVWRIVFPLNAQ